MKKYIFPLLVAISIIARATNDSALTFTARVGADAQKLSERLNKVWET